MAKRFTLAEAQRLIPEVDRLLREALEAKSEYQESEQAIRAFSERVMMMGGIVVDRDRALAARTRLAMVDIGGLIVRDVDAMVLPDQALSENLLGLSFLSKLKRFEYANGQLVLEQ